MELRRLLSPAVLVSVVALVIAAGGAGYAGTLIGSAQIKNNSIRSVDIKNGAIASKDIKNGTVTSTDIKDHTIAPVDLKKTCASGSTKVLGACTTLKASGPTTYMAAVAACSGRGGYIATLADLDYLQQQVGGFVWADGNANQYEFTSSYATTFPVYPIARDRNGDLYGVDPEAQSFWYHCVVPL